MFRVDADGPVEFCNRLSRREFLHAGSLSMMGLTLPSFLAMNQADAATPDKDMNCIFLFLVGGPSQLDTFDMKPDAPAEIRGPFKPTRTNNPDIQISEIFPRTAKHADKFSIIRTLHHEAAGVHDAGHQLMQTGRYYSNNLEQPNAGCVYGYLRGAKHDMPPHVLLPRPMGNTGGNMPHGQSAGFLGKAHDPFVPNDELDLSGESQALRDAYGQNKFGQNCLRARRLIERGARFVTINMFETVFNETTWDIHGAAPYSSIDCYRDYVGPMFDHAYSSLLEDLSQRGMLDNTMVIATGEFGRTPKINPAGGRDHWPQVWSMLMAGGGIQGGRVVGKTDAIGAYPIERPVTPQEVVATMYHQLGVNLETELPSPSSRPVPIVDYGTKPIQELL